MYYIILNEDLIFSKYLQFGMTPLPKDQFSKFVDNFQKHLLVKGFQNFKFLWFVIEIVFGVVLNFQNITILLSVLLNENTGHIWEIHVINMNFSKLEDMKMAV